MLADHRVKARGLTMKSVYKSAFVLLAVLAGLLVAGCEMGSRLVERETSSGGTSGKSLVRFLLPGALYDSRTVYPSVDTANLIYRIFAYNSSSGTDIPVGTFNGGSVIQAWVSEGSWAFRLEAFPAGTTDFFSDNTVFLAYAPEVQILLSSPLTEVALQMNYTNNNSEGTGSISVSYSLPSGSGVIGAEYLLNGVKGQTFFPIDAEQVILALSDVPSGPSLLTTQFMGSDGRILGTRTDLCHILANTVSEAYFSIPSGALQSPVTGNVPASPVLTSVDFVMGEGSFCEYLVKWVDASSDERGFAVFMDGSTKPLAVVLQNASAASVFLPTGSSVTLYVVAFNSNGASVPSNPQTVTPQPTIAVYVNLMGGSIDGYPPAFTLQTPENTPVTLPGTPIKNGYILQGWYQDYDLTIPFDLGTPVTGAVSLYAKWISADLDLTETGVGTNLMVYTNNSTISLGGTVVSSNGTPDLVVSRNGVDVTVARNGSDWSVVESALFDGIYTYVITASLNGSEVTLYRTIYLDTVKPTAMVTNPVSSPYIFSSAYQLFTLTVSDSGSGVNQVRYSIDGTTWQDAGDAGSGDWIMNPLDDVSGYRTLAYEVYDQAGNVETGAFQYTNDFDSVTVTETEINTTDLVYRNSGTYPLKGVATAATAPAISLVRNGTTLQTWGSSTVWSYQETDLADGLYTYTITATSVGGKTTSITRDVFVDSTQPEISVTSTQTVFNAPTQVFEGTVSDGTGSGLSTIEYSLDNTTWTQITPASGIWTLNLNDGVEGSRTVYIKATDVAGNSTTIDILYTNSFSGSVSVTVSIVNPAEPDLSFSPGSGSLSIPYTSTGNVEISAPAGYTGYVWKLNGTELAQTNNVCTINLASGEAKDLYLMGTNTLSLIINDNGEYYSGSYTFTVTN